MCIFTKNIRITYSITNSSYLLCFSNRFAKDEVPIHEISPVNDKVVVVGLLFHSDITDTLPVVSEP